MKLDCYFCGSDSIIGAVYVSDMMLKHICYNCLLKHSELYYSFNSFNNYDENHEDLISCCDKLYTFSFPEK